MFLITAHVNLVFYGIYFIIIMFITIKYVSHCNIWIYFIMYVFVQESFVFATGTFLAIFITLNCCLIIR